MASILARVLGLESRSGRIVIDPEVVPFWSSFRIAVIRPGTANVSASRFQSQRLSQERVGDDEPCKAEADKH